MALPLVVAGVVAAVAVAPEVIEGAEARGQLTLERKLLSPQAGSQGATVSGKPIQAMGKKRTAKKTPTTAELTERAMKVTDTGRLRDPG